MVGDHINLVRDSKVYILRDSGEMANWRSGFWHQLSFEEAVAIASTTSNSEHLPMATETITVETTEVVTSEGKGWTSEMEVQCSANGDGNGASIHQDDEDDGSEGEDLVGHGRTEDSMTEVELWQQLENELYRPPVTEEEAGIAKEIREEEDAAAAEVAESTSESLLPGPTSETRRFYPPGKIMHIVSVLPDGPVHQDDADKDSSSAEEDHHIEPEKQKIGIFLTPRSLYGKLRLSQMMINDHYMPIYRRNIEQLIAELENNEKDASVNESSCPL